MKKTRLVGNIQVPGDKAISHRALIFASLCKGISYIEGLSPAEDCQSTASCLRQLGISIHSKKNGDKVSSTIVESKGLEHFSAPQNILFVGNSGTTIRLLSGLLAGRPFISQFDGDESIRKRPMARVLEHLESMGIEVTYETHKGLAPFKIKGGNLRGQEFKLKVASAQVQTALLLAGLQANGKTSVYLPTTVRDHTLRMFNFIGIPCEQIEKNAIRVEALKEPSRPFKLAVPSDISSAAFFMVAAACLPGSDLTLTNVGINPGRTLVIDVLEEMGANIELLNNREVAGEPVADIRVKGEERLKGINVDGADIARGVDEIPALALAGALCEGKFSVSGAAELRHKESDRLKLIVQNLKNAGANIEELEDGLIIEGKKNISGGSYWQTAHDHRLAMAGLIANLLFDQPVNIEEIESTAISYPGFNQDLQSLLCH